MTKLLGHRGARHEAPENTLAGFEVALAAGVEGIELDVRACADGRLVVIHDETLDRTTNGSGPVASLGLEELQRLDAGAGERIPTLLEVLERVRGRLERLFIELKEPGGEEALLADLDRTGMRRDVLVKSFHHRWVASLKRRAPDLATGCLLVGTPVDPVGLVRAAGAEALSLSLASVDRALVEACRAGGVAVCAWNLNDPAALPEALALGLDWLGTDLPSRMAPALRTARGR